MQVIFNQLKELLGRAGSLIGLNFNVSLGRKAEVPQVLDGGLLVNILSNLGALGFVEKDLGLGFGGLAHARDFHLGAEGVLVRNLFVGQVVSGGNVFENNAIFSADGLTLSVLSNAACGLDSPHGVVSLAMVSGNFLVAGVASESHRSKGQRVQIHFIVAELRVSAKTYVLAVSDLIVFAFVAVFNLKDGAAGGSIAVDSGSHSTRVAGDHLIVGVDHEHALGAVRLKHDAVAGVEAAVSSVGKRNLN